MSDTEDLKINAPEPIDPELERLLTWFVHSNSEIAKTYGFNKLVIAPHDTFLKKEDKSEDIKFLIYGLKS